MSNEPGQNEGGSEFRQKFEKLQEENQVIPGLKQENTLLKLGIDPDAGKAKLFRDAYKGEWEAEAVKAALSDYGLDDLLTPQAAPDPQAEQEQQSRQQEAAAMQRMASAGNGQGEPGQVSYDEFEDADALLAHLVANGEQLASDMD